MNRRSFIEKSGSLAIASVVLGGAACKQSDSSSDSYSTGSDLSDSYSPGSQSLGKVGIQLYSLRHITNGNFPEILQNVADAGYQELEFAGYHGHSADELRQLTDKLGLDPVSTHVGIEDLQKDLDGIVGYAADLGIDYVTCPWVGDDHRSAEGYTELGTLFNKYGEACQQKGLQFAYHNHDFEYIEYDGKPGYDYLLEACDQDLVKQELDIFWITKAGKDPLEYFEKYPGIFHLSHVKDMKGIGAGEDMVPVGAGDIDFGKIFAARETSGMKHFIVEHDDPKDPLAFLRESSAHLANLKF